MFIISRPEFEESGYNILTRAAGSPGLEPPSWCCVGGVLHESVSQLMEKDLSLIDLFALLSI